MSTQESTIVTIQPASRTARARRRAVVIGLPPLIWVALIWLALMVFAAVFAEALALHPMDELFLRNRLAPPGDPAFPLGTDNLGRDIFSRLLFSIRISMFVGAVSTVISGVLGTLLGLVAARFGGLVDDAVMLLVDFQLSLPGIVFALAMLAVFGNSFVVLIIVLSLLGWQTYTRIARGMALAALEQGYVEAARALGVTQMTLFRRHILPNIASPLIVGLTLNFPGVIIAEASLSFLGLGIQPPDTSLGLMLSIGRDTLASAWWAAIFPGLVIFLITLSVTLLGDWLRDYIDPITRR